MLQNLRRQSVNITTFKEQQSQKEEQRTVKPKETNALQFRKRKPSIKQGKALLPRRNKIVKSCLFLSCKVSLFKILSTISSVKIWFGF
jgi:hypothetical protein